MITSCENRGNQYKLFWKTEENVFWFMSSFVFLGIISVQILSDRSHPPSRTPLVLCFSGQSVWAESGRKVAEIDGTWKQYFGPEKSRIFLTFPIVSGEWSPRPGLYSTCTSLYSTRTPEYWSLAFPPLAIVM